MKCELSENVTTVDASLVSWFCTVRKGIVGLFQVLPHKIMAISTSTYQ
jgi:hypothetical protein